ncbi:unnamed protein product, partial [Allacma fusca]
MFTSLQTTLELAHVVADLVYYLCGNIVGLYSQLLSEITIRRAFLDRRGYIKSTIKKKYEKDQEEQLLLSILPNHISTKVKNELLTAITTLKQDQLTKKHSSYGSGHSEHRHLFHHHHKNNRKPKTLMQKKPFSNLYVEKHTNVTILYADIVNFTPLTVKLKADELVDTLNELFGRFDEAAANFNCLRIKLLGDCYYCVSGIPTPTPSHAKNCVQLGFEMIEIVKDVREKLNVRLGVDVSMRIGIHSGKILSGLLGIYKWQYDIWSKDATIANHMEQSGRAGRIHITRQTRDFLGNEYSYEPYHGNMRDKYLAENDIETFLIVSPHGLNHNDDTFHEEPYNKAVFNRGTSNAPVLKRQTSSIQKSLDIRKKSRVARSEAGVEGVESFRNLMSQVNEKMAKAID